MKDKNIYKLSDYYIRHTSIVSVAPLEKPSKMIMNETSGVSLNWVCLKCGSVNYDVLCSKCGSSKQI